jgi:uncharacterized damage-inducible protein DinB
MTIIEAFAQELEREAVTTRKMLERVPTDKYDWKPHEKSMELRKLAAHVAELPGWVALTLTTSELDFATSPYVSPPVETNRELLSYFEKSLNDGQAELSKATPADLELPWTLRNGETIYSTESKREVIRMSLSQIIHHRAQLGVYLRLLNIPIPGSYGPSADEMDF